MADNKNGEKYVNYIHCDVANCTYNDDYFCTAKKVDVGPTYATSSADTICVTFKPGKSQSGAYSG